MGAKRATARKKRRLPRLIQSGSWPGPNRDRGTISVNTTLVHVSASRTMPSAIPSQTGMAGYVAGRNAAGTGPSIM